MPDQSNIPFVINADAGDTLREAAGTRWQRLALELADGAFDEFDRAAGFVDALRGAKSLADVSEIESKYIRGCLHTLADHACRANELCVGIAQDFLQSAPGRSTAA